MRPIRNTCATLLSVMEVSSFLLQIISWTRLVLFLLRDHDSPVSFTNSCYTTSLNVLCSSHVVNWNLKKNFATSGHIINFNILITRQSSLLWIRDVVIGFSFFDVSSRFFHVNISITKYIPCVASYC